jgi:uncharacterized ion transporter superfamily protein YfcC
MAVVAAEKPKRQFAFPTAYTILALLIFVMAAMTFIIPAGRYDLDEDGAPIPGTYHQVESNPQRIRDAVIAPIDGMYGIKGEDGLVDPYNVGTLYGAIDVGLFILIIGGFLGISMKTGAIDAGIGAIVKRLGTRGKFLIMALMAVFAAGGTSYGMAEESLAFYVLIISAIIALGYDALTGVAILLLGAGIGTMGSTINPFATGIASGFAGIPLGEGIVYRIIILVAGVAIGMWWVLRYAGRVKEDAAKSLVADMKEDNERHFLRKGEESGTPELTSKGKLILGLFGLAFLIMIYSVIPWSDLGIPIPTLFWWFSELSALFLVFAVIIGLVHGMREKELVDNFIDGSRDLLGVALVVGLARGISVIMNNGLIIDTVLHAMETSLGTLPPVVFINAVFLVYLPLSFLIPSSSGLATVTMPIMAPLGGFAGVPEHLIVTAYQSASGLLNLFTPTFAVVTGGLAIGRVPINVWWRFVLPLVGMLGVMIMLVLTIGVLLGT